MYTASQLLENSSSKTLYPNNPQTQNLTKTLSPIKFSINFHCFDQKLFDFRYKMATAVLLRSLRRRDLTSGPLSAYKTVSIHFLSVAKNLCISVFFWSFALFVVDIGHFPDLSLIRYVLHANLAVFFLLLWAMKFSFGLLGML